MEELNKSYYMQLMEVSMKTQYKTIKIISVLVFSMFLSGDYALASTVEGMVQGLNCVLYGKLCPVDKNDPHLAAESVFVVFSDKNDYKIVANLNRMILSRYLGHKVRVKGDVTPYSKATGPMLACFLCGFSI